MNNFSSIIITIEVKISIKEKKNQNMILLVNMYEKKKGRENHIMTHTQSINGKKGSGKRLNFIISKHFM